MTKQAKPSASTASDAKQPPAKARRQRRTIDNALKLKIDEEERKLEIQQGRTVERYQWWVKFLAVVIPSGVLGLIALGVFANRLVSGKSNIPAARRRQA